MIKLLARLFIKNDDYTNTETRRKYGVLCGAFGIFLNILLFVGKFVCGLISKSIAITADAFNNLSDAGSSLISLLGFKLAGKKPDSNHPFGHGRLEYISALIVSMLIILMGFELGKSSVENIIQPVESNFNLATIIILIVSILVKIYMTVYNKFYGKKMDSVAMKATGTDSLCDSISTFVVLICTIVSKFVNFNLDGIAGLLVAIFIVYSGISSAKETVEVLLGTRASKEFVDEIEKTVLAHKEILGVHDLVVHDYGPGRVMLSLHAEVDGKSNIFAIHEKIDEIENELNQKFDLTSVIHMDPIETDNEQLNEMREKIKKIVSNINDKFTAHDIRFVPGENRTNVIFDVVLTPNFYGKEDEVRKLICDAVQKESSQYNCVIKFDCNFCE